MSGRCNKTTHATSDTSSWLNAEPITTCSPRSQLSQQQQNILETAALMLKAVIICAQVREVAIEAIERARRGDGPTLIEAQTYRFRGHSLADPDELREKKEKDYWQVHPSERKGEEMKKTTPFGVNLMESQILYQAAQGASPFMSVCFTWVDAAECMSKHAAT